MDLQTGAMLVGIDAWRLSLKAGPSPSLDQVSHGSCALIRLDVSLDTAHP